MMRIDSRFYERRSLRRRVALLFAMAKLRAVYWLWRGIQDAFRIGFRPRDTSNNEFWMGFFSMALGVWLMLPGDAFSPPFRAMRYAMPEWIWGLLFVAAGRFALHALVQARYRLRSTAQSILCGSGLFLLVLSIDSRSGSVMILVSGIYSWRCLMISRQLSAGDK